MTERTDRRGPVGVRFEARCAWCGPVPIDDVGLGLHVSSGYDALLEFGCPRCGNLNVRPLGSGEVATLALAGIHRAGGAAPFELLEERSGPPIGWDDLLEFHQSLSEQDRRWDDPDRTVSVPGPDRERDAA